MNAALNRPAYSGAVKINAGSFWEKMLAGLILFQRLGPIKPLEVTAGHNSVLDAVNTLLIKEVAHVQSNMRPSMRTIL